MRITKQIFGLLALVVILTAPAVASACPSCQDAPAAKSADEEGSGNPAAYNNSIYVMVSVPYLTLAIGGFFVYRGMRKNEEFRRAHGWTVEQGPANPPPS